jgi:hypothetical protein
MAGGISILLRLSIMSILPCVLDGCSVTDLSPGRLFSWLSQQRAYKAPSPAMLGLSPLSFFYLRGPINRLLYRQIAGSIPSACDIAART